VFKKSPSENNRPPKKQGALEKKKEKIKARWEENRKRGNNHKRMTRGVEKDHNLIREKKKTWVKKQGD